MKTINNLFKTVTLLALTLVCGNYSAQAQQAIIPQLSGTETLKIADPTNPIGTFNASGTYKIKVFRTPVATGMNYTNSIKAKGTIYVAVISGINHTGTNVQYALVWTNTTGNITTYQNADLAAQIDENGNTATITIQSKHHDLAILGINSASYLPYLGNKSYLADFTTLNKGTVGFLCLQPAGNSLFLIGNIEGSSRRINLPDGKVEIKSKAIGFRF